MPATVAERRRRLARAGPRRGPTPAAKQTSFLPDPSASVLPPPLSPSPSLPSPGGGGRLRRARASRARLPVELFRSSPRCPRPDAARGPAGARAGFGSFGGGRGVVASGPTGVRIGGAAEGHGPAERGRDPARRRPPRDGGQTRHRKPVS